MSRTRVVAVATFAVWVLSATSVTPARACSGETPSFAQAVSTARAIARVIVSDVAEYGDADAAETFEVVRTLKGELPATFRLDEPHTGLCGDPIGYYVGQGGEAIVAFGVPFYGTLVNPAWVHTGHLVEPLTSHGSWAPEGVTTLDELEALILSTLPDTAMSPSPITPSVAITMVGTALVSAGLCLAIRRTRRT